MTIIQSAVSNLLLNVLLAVIVLVGAYATYFIQKATAEVKARTAKLKNEDSRTLLDNAISDVEHLAMKTVGAIEQTTAKQLREAVKDGKTDREELLALGKQAFDDVKAAILPETQDIIADNLGDFDAYLQKVIEDAVRKIKQEDPYITLPANLLE